MAEQKFHGKARRGCRFELKGEETRRSHETKMGRGQLDSKGTDEKNGRAVQGRSGERERIGTGADPGRIDGIRGGLKDGLEL